MKILLQVGYIGSRYRGYQRQPGTGETIQTILEEALEKALGERVKTLAAGRTDKGVHSKAQMVQLEIKSQKAGKIPLERYPRTINPLLPEDIRIYGAWLAPESFHVRYSKSLKTYCYRLDTGAVPQLESVPFALHYPYPLDREKMEGAAATLIGTHDFSAFASRYSGVKDRVRTIWDCRLEESGPYYSLIIQGNGFLHSMVRIIMGSLLDIGRGRLDQGIFLEAIRSGNRRILGKTAAAKGLTLEAIEYEEVPELDQHSFGNRL